MNVSSAKYLIKILNEKGPWYLFRNIAKFSGAYCFHFFMFPMYFYKTKSLPQKMLIENVLNFVDYDCYGVYKPLQVHSEIVRLLKYVEKMKPKIVVEIGTANGGTLLSLIKTSSPKVAISIDMPGGAFGGGYAWYKILLFHAFVKEKQQIYLIRADSHALSTKGSLEKILGKEKIDFLLIDGDHTYEGVKKDFKLYAPLVKKNGVIAFHDIVVHNAMLNCGVSTFWNQLKKKYRSQTFVENWKQGFCGIGIILKN